MKRNKLKIILGTSSKPRRRVFDTCGLEYEVMHPDIDEKAIRFNDPEKLVLAIAGAKADALMKRITEPAVIITADTVVVWNNEIREKPKDKEEAILFFTSYYKSPAITYTGLVVTNAENGRRAHGFDVARISFKEMPMDVLEKMVSDGDVMNAAGAFLVDDPYSRPFIDTIEGTEDSLSGLPILLLKRLFNEVGIHEF